MITFQISEDTLKREIPNGAAQKNIERFASPQTGQSGTLPRIRYEFAYDLLGLR